MTQIIATPQMLKIGEYEIPFREPVGYQLGAYAGRNAVLILFEERYAPRLAREGDKALPNYVKFLRVLALPQSPYPEEVESLEEKIHRLNLGGVEPITVSLGVDAGVDTCVELALTSDHYVQIEY